MPHFLAHKKLFKSVVVTTTLSDTWQRWTTSKGIASFFCEKNNIKLEVGGSFELYFSKDAPMGSKGSEGCKVLSFLPNEMLSFSWNVPPSFPELRKSGAQNWVVLQFQAVSNNKTLVELNHYGWQAGNNWDGVYQYFESAWETVLANFKESCLTPIDFSTTAVLPEENETNGELELAFNEDPEAENPEEYSSDDANSYWTKIESNSAERRITFADDDEMEDADFGDEIHFAESDKDWDTIHALTALQQNNDVSELISNSMQLHLNNVHIILSKEEILENLIAQYDSLQFKKLSAMKKTLKKLETNQFHTNTPIVFYADKLKKVKKELKELCEKRTAGGGLVINEAGELLLIYRRGKWDLPKGHMEKGESIKETALREVSEETGVTQLELVTELYPFNQKASLHIFTTKKGKRVLKETFWYLMKCKGRPEPIPQIEEDIETIHWVHPSDLSLYLPHAYPSVVEVINVGSALLPNDY